MACVNIFIDNTLEEESASGWRAVGRWVTEEVLSHRGRNRWMGWLAFPADTQRVKRRRKRTTTIVAISAIINTAKAKIRGPG